MLKQSFNFGSVRLRSRLSQASLAKRLENLGNMHKDFHDFIVAFRGFEVEEIMHKRTSNHLVRSYELEAFELSLKKLETRRFHDVNSYVL